MEINNTVTDLFESITKEDPDLPAIIQHEKTYTFLQLNRHANALAQFLINKKISHGDFVGVFLEPSYDFLLSIIGIIKSEAVYLPLDTLAPKNRIHSILEDANPKLIITSKKHSSYFTKLKLEICLIEELVLEPIIALAQEKKSLRPESPFCLMYTSGSTGKPKGVVISHRGVINIARDNSIDIHPNDRMAQFGNLAFDGSIYDIWTTLLNKATLVITSIEERGNHQKLKHVLNAKKINYLFLPTGYLHQIASSHPDTLDQVDHILFGGEAINVNIIKKFLQYRLSKNLPILLVNGYGPTETTCYVCRNKITLDSLDKDLRILGQKIPNTELYILDNNLCPVEEGELYITGSGLAVGYHNSSELNKEKFKSNPFNNNKIFSRMYKTGDLVKRLDNGELLYLGRVDDQVKIAGFRVHLNEIEAQLQKHEAITMAAVVVELGGEKHKMLSAYMVFKPDSNIIHADEIRKYLEQTLPPYMIPAKYHKVEELPLNNIGKVDKKNLHQLPFIDLTFHIDVSSYNEIEEVIKNVWKHLLNRPIIETDKNLFDLGANSLLIAEACMQINQIIHSDLTMADILSFPTIQKLAAHIQGVEKQSHLNRVFSDHHDNKIAIVGMSIRLPKSNNINEFWSNLCEGKDCLSRFNEVDKIHRENTVSVKGILDNVELFDHAFFKYSHTEASLTDPQHRLYFECVWEALEHAGIAPNKMKTKVISVFSGMSDSTYLYEHILKNKETRETFDTFEQRIATSMGTLSTQASYRLNLKGMSASINTACSTGLITVTQACQDLISGQSDIAIAGASSIIFPQLRGYKYTTGSILSPDGYCRPFSNQSNGTVFSNGVAVVILKRLKDAIADRNTIYAIIEGYGLNNDGDDKLSYTAPSLNGQIECINNAFRQSNVRPHEIGFIETHGTGTALGDLIEFDALCSLFNEETENKHFCALGSVKANIGHTDVVAGTVGLIKAALCLYHKQIPPLIHFQKPNPNLSFNDSPFFINTTLIDWKSKAKRYAGVSSFGVGGTNAHVILSEYKQAKSYSEKNKPVDELIILSAKTEQALKQQKNQLLAYMQTLSLDKNIKLADIAYTLQTGREDFQWRTIAIGKDSQHLADSLLQDSPREHLHRHAYSINFLFSGQGTQYAAMCTNMMNTIPRFKKYIKDGCQLAQKHLSIDLFSVLHNNNSDLINQTQYAQPALFIIEHALAQILIDCGIKPSALLGHSFGEYVAACISKVFSYEDGIYLSCKRGELMAQTMPGSMLAFEGTLDESRVYQQQFNVEIALHNATHQFVFSGTSENIALLQQEIEQKKRYCKLLKNRHAFHSKLMEPIEKSFKELFSKIKLSAPVIPIVSNLTGDWLSEHEATDPEYWYQHLRSCVQYNMGTELILKDKHPVFIEIGPGNILLQCTRQTANYPIDAIQTIPGHLNNEDDRNYFMKALGLIWKLGIDINFEPLYEKTKSQYVALPTYPFQRERCWIDPEIEENHSPESSSLYKQIWSKRRTYIDPKNLNFSTLNKHDWIVFKDRYEMANNLIILLKSYGIDPIIVHLDANSFFQNSNEFYIDGSNKAHYLTLLQLIKKTLRNPIVIHCSSLFHSESPLLQDETINCLLTNGFYSILYLSQAFANILGPSNQLKLAVITNGILNISGTEIINPPNATIKGALMVLMQENPYFRARLFDVNCDETIEKNNNFFSIVLNYCIEPEWDINNSYLYAYRNNYEWYYTYEKIKVPSERRLPLKDYGVYLITGGLGGVALNCCDIITKTIKSPSLILLTRKDIPLEKEWDQISKDHKHPLYNEIIKLINLKNEGAKLHLCQVDITNQIELKKSISLIGSTNGTINGVIHAAGEVHISSFRDKSKSICDQTFLPKIHGTYNLIESLNQIPLDFIVFISSLSSLVGGIGLVDYSAANAGLDAFADSDIVSFATFVQSINWNTWQQTGMTKKYDKNNTYSLDNKNNITPDEGKILFIEALSSNENHLAVSKLAPITNIQTAKDKNINTSFAESGVKLQTHHEINPVEQKMVELWKNILGSKEVGLNDDFFYHGGHSLLALKMIDRINKTFGCSLSPQQLYKTPTIKSLIKEIELANRQDKDDIIVPMKIINKSSPFLFLFHPINGLLFSFNSFISESDLNLSILGIQDPSTKKSEFNFTQLTDIANVYLQSIVKAQPKGPYYFLGYSFGGNICYEVASLLQKRGENVALLAMIDSWAIHPAFSKEKSFFEAFMKGILSEPSPVMSELAWKRQKLLLSHNISRTSQKIILFKAKELLAEYQLIDKPTNGWSDYTDNNVICYEISGNHHSIMERDSIKKISNILKKYI